MRSLVELISVSLRLLSAHERFWAPLLHDFGVISIPVSSKLVLAHILLHILIDKTRTARLLVIILSLISNNVEELEAVLSLGRADNTQPIAQLLLLEKLLRQVLQVTTRKLLVSHNFNSSITEVGDSDVVAKVTGAALNLDALLEESRESGRVEDAVLGGLGGVDDELNRGASQLPRRLYGDRKVRGGMVYLLGHLLALLLCASGGLLLQKSHSAYCSMPETASEGVMAGSKAKYILLRQPFWRWTWLCVDVGAKKWISCGDVKKYWWIPRNEIMYVGLTRDAKISQNQAVLPPPVHPMASAHL